jgi:hypothetical protein
VFLFKGQGAPWEEKGHKGTLLKMPRRSTSSVIPSLDFEDEVSYFDPNAFY